MSDYITPDELRDYIGSNTTLNQSLVDAVVTVASREVDDWCGRKFWADTSVSARVFPVDEWFRTYTDDIAEDTSVVVEVDSDFNQSYDQTWTVTTDYILEPVNPSNQGIQDPWTCIRATGTTRYFPYVATNYQLWMRNPNPVRVTAKWGWPVVPDQVHHAALIGAAYLFKMKDAPDGFIGLDGWGPRQIREAPMFKQLLERFRKTAVAVA